MEWDQEEIEAAAKLVRDVYEEYYAHRTELLLDPAPELSAAKPSALKTKKVRSL